MLRDTAFTDGAPGLRSILAEAGCKIPPIADWFHIAMRLQHAKHAASGWSTDTPDRMQAKHVPTEAGGGDRAASRTPALADLERQGKKRTATLDRARKVMHAFRGERSCRTTAVLSSRKLWRALREVDTYLRGQSSRLVNYAKR